jgi:hypothetical protein
MDEDETALLAELDLVPVTVLLTRSEFARLTARQAFTPDGVAWQCIREHLNLAPVPYRFRQYTARSARWAELLRRAGRKS